MKKGLLLIAVLLSAAAAMTIGTVGLLNRDTDGPPDTSDLLPERVELTDDENAFTHFNAAVEALDWPERDTDEYKLIEQTIEGKQDNTAFADEFLERNRRLLELMKRGLDCHICQPPEVTRIWQVLPHTDTWRRLSRLLQFKIAADRQAGQITEAVTTCCDLLRFGDLVQKDAVDPVNWVIGTSFMMAGQVAARELANMPDCTEDDMARLAEALVRIEPLERGLVRALKGEYQIAAGSVDDAAAKQKKPSTFGIHPNKTKHAMADFYRCQITNAPRIWAEVVLRTPDEAFRDHQGRVATAVGANYAGKMLYDMITDGCGRVEHRCGQSCGLAATRLIVACKRYEKAHGELPPTLEALVPQYLDAVPIDPFDGRPFKYARDKRIAYAVGTDLIDSGGSTKSTTSEPINRDWGHLSLAEDAVSHIDGWTCPEERKAPPTSPPR